MGMTAVTGDEKSASVLKSALKLVLLSRAKKTSGFSMAAFLKEIRVEVEGTEVHVSGVSFEDAELLTLVETLNRKDKEGDS